MAWKIFGDPFWTGVLLIPWVAPTVVSALNFLWIYDYSLGVLNYLLVRVFHILPQGHFQSGRRESLSGQVDGGGQAAAHLLGGGKRLDLGRNGCDQ